LFDDVFDVKPCGLRLTACLRRQAQAGALQFLAQFDCALTCLCNNRINPSESRRILRIEQISAPFVDEIPVRSNIIALARRKEEGRLNSEPPFLIYGAQPRGCSSSCGCRQLCY
jgi:hypothetical protein